MKIKHVRKYPFGLIFPVSKECRLPLTEYIDTIKESNLVRYQYYGTPSKHTGTIYAHLSDGNIPDNTEFHKDIAIGNY